MEIDIWNNQQMQEHIDAKNYPIEKLPGRSVCFKGFTYFSPEFVELRLKTEDSVVNSKKDRSIVALDNTNLVGVFSFLWMKGNYSFHHYFPRFIDVRGDKLHHGIGTALVKRLNEPCFLWDETLVLSAGDYSTMGSLYIRKVVERELAGKHFRIFDRTKVRLEYYR